MEGAVGGSAGYSRCAMDVSAYGALEVVVGGGGKIRCDEMICFFSYEAVTMLKCVSFIVHHLSLPADLLCCASCIFVTLLAYAYL